MAILTNLADLREYTNSLLSQPGAFTDAALNEMINVAYKKFIATAECLEDVRSISSVVHRNEYPLPGSIIKVSDVFYRGKLLEMNNLRGILRDNLSGKLLSETNTSTDVYKCYTRNYGNSMYLGIFGIPDDGADTTTLDENITSATTEFDLASIAGFEHTGAFLLQGAEVIHYTHVDGVQVSGLIRSAEDTTAAATNGIGDVVIERDIICYVVPNPADLSGDSSVPLVDESYRETIVKGALMAATLSLKMFDIYVKYRQEFYEECQDIRGKFNFKEPGKKMRIRPFLHKYAY